MHGVVAILIACAFTALLACAGAYVVRLMRNVDDLALRLGVMPTAATMLALRGVMAVGLAIVSLIVVTIWVALFSGGFIG